MRTYVNIKHFLELSSQTLRFDFKIYDFSQVREKLTLEFPAVNVLSFPIVMGHRKLPGLLIEEETHIPISTIIHNFKRNQGSLDGMAAGGVVMRGEPQPFMLPARTLKWCLLPCAKPSTKTDIRLRLQISRHPPTVAHSSRLHSTVK